MYNFLINTHQAIAIKVSDAELALFSEGDTSIAFQDGSGYLAEMGMYHELHCIVSSNHRQMILYSLLILLHFRETSKTVPVPGPLLSKPDR